MKNLVIALMCYVSLVGCQSVPEGTLELKKRAVKKERVPKVLRKQGSQQRIERIRIGGRFLESGDWFHGAYVSIVVTENEFVFDDPVLNRIKGGR